MTESYPIPSEDFIFEEEIKHSRFISILFRCDSNVQFKEKLAEIRIKFPGATHYCQAYITGNPLCTMSVGSSDDGEPAGSAGRPMLAVLQGAGIGEVGAVVVRYFGGIKLGVGGLVRAYSSGLKQALPLLPTELKLIRYPATLECDYNLLRNVEYVIDQHQGMITDRHFGSSVVVIFVVPTSQQHALNVQLANVTQGLVQATFE